MSDTVTVSGIKKGIGKGAIKIKVVDVCTNKPIEKAEARTSGGKAVSDSNGLAGLKGLPEGKHFVLVTKRYPEADPYITFLSHYPKVTMEHKAESKALVDVKLGKGETKDIEVKLKVYRVIKEIIFRRMEIGKDAGGGIQYGHWWVKVGEDESYGWWPKYKLGDPRNATTIEPEEPQAPSENAGGLELIGYLFKKIYYSIDSFLHSIKESRISQTFWGVEGELNGRAFGGSATRDPHHDHTGEYNFQPIVHDTRTDDQIKQSAPCNCQTFELIRGNIREFADSYTEKYGGRWSWRFETLGNDNCHTFQIRMIDYCKLDKFKQL